MPIIPITIQNHKVWVYVDSGATFSTISASEARDMGFEWQSDRQQMVVVGDGSFIPVFIHDVPVEIGSRPITIPIGFLSASVSGSIFSAARECSTSSKFASTIT
jgi:hypothetical protein